jgi:hydroxypyruvate reductase
MIIQNYQELATTEKKKHCLEILESGLRVAEPENIMQNFVTSESIRIENKIIEFKDYNGIYTVAFGKAGDSMTRALNDIVSIKSGIIVIPKGSRSKIKGKKFQIFNSSHPKPDKTSVKAAKEVIKFLQNRRKNDLVIFLVSGGGSSLLAIPDDITLEDKIYVTELLLKSGATIQEFNCLRKHLSKIKGGKLVENIKCDGIGLIMSDVQDDDLSAIASGTTYMDNTTFLDAINILNKYNLKRKVPLEVLKKLEDGKNGEIPETPKTPKIENYIVASNKNCLREMENKAKELGYKTKTIQVFGNIKDATQIILENIQEEPNSCLLFGGETTVEVLGKGSGGRNQEMVLRILKNTQHFKKIVIASMGTDGIDGNTLFAGAITENIKVNSETIKEFLRNSDSARFFQKHKCNIITGFTHTNLMDVGMVLS